MRFFSLPFALVSLIGVAHAQFGFFDQMFGGGHQGHHHHQPQNVPSDSNAYMHNYMNSYCDNYLCPDTLGALSSPNSVSPDTAGPRLTSPSPRVACVHFPHHCPCQWPTTEHKVELADGQRICVSKGGFKEGEAARKVELARKGLL
jgi:hypothetical protein